MDCRVIPTTIIHMFIRAERESDWLLVRMHYVQQMPSHFIAAGHSNYARYGTWYILERQGALPTAACQKFLNGDHVCRHMSAIWNSVFSDHFGKQTYIRYSKAKVESDQVAGWRTFFSYQCSGHGPYSTAYFGGFGLWVIVKVLGSDSSNRFANTNHNLNRNSNDNLTITPKYNPTLTLT